MLSPQQRGWLERIEVAPGGCWMWTGAPNRDGYPRIGQRQGGRKTCKTAHRVLYEMLVGSVPDDLTLDHLCHTRDRSCKGGPTCQHRRCVNPGHLEPVTRGENVLRSHTAPSAVNARKTHCKRGHPLVFDNLYHSASTVGRQCRQCRRDRQCRYAHAKRAAMGNSVVPTSKAHCRNGHERSPENTYVAPGGSGRQCVPCRAAAHDRYSAKVASQRRPVELKPGPRRPFETAKRSNCSNGHPCTEAGTYAPPNGAPRRCRECRRAARRRFEAGSTRQVAAS